MNYCQIIFAPELQIDPADFVKAWNAEHRELAEAQQQWEQAQAYYQQALAIDIEFNDRYAQALTYVQLGSVAVRQERRAEAKNYYLTALRLFVEFADEYHTNFALGNLAFVYQHTPDDSLLVAVSEVLGMSEEDVREAFKRANEETQD